MGLNDDGTTAISWLATFKQLMLNPENTIENYDMDFLTVVKWSREFLILKPLVDAAVVVTLCERLERHGCRLDFELISRMQVPAAFVKCSCNVYRHYAWCSCCCLWALDQKLILQIPLNLDPRKLRKQQNLGGRHAKSKPGGALTMGDSSTKKQAKGKAKAHTAKRKRVIPADSDEDE